MQQNLIHGSIAFDDNLTVFLQAEWSDMEKHQTVILLTRGLKERGKISEHFNTLVQASPLCCTSTVDVMVYHVGWMDQKKGRLVCQKKTGNDLAGQTERKLFKMRQMLPGLSGS
jgi:hypothetical protein